MWRWDESRSTYSSPAAHRGGCTSQNDDSAQQHCATEQRSRCPETRPSLPPGGVVGCRSCAIECSSTGRRRCKGTSPLAGSGRVPWRTPPRIGPTAERNTRRSTRRENRSNTLDPRTELDAFPEHRTPSDPGSAWRWIHLSPNACGNASRRAVRLEGIGPKALETISHALHEHGLDLS
jgi:hypothetical protein